MKQVLRLGWGLRGERGSPEGPGAQFRNLAFARKLCRVKSCYCKAACARPLPLTQMLARPLSLPGCLHSQDEEPTAALHASAEEGLPGDGFSGTVGDSAWEMPSVRCLTPTCTLGVGLIKWRLA